MRILSAITDPGVARRILECVDMPLRAPPLGKPKGGSAELLSAQESRNPGPVSTEWRGMPRGRGGPLDYLRR